MKTQESTDWMDDFYSLYKKGRSKNAPESYIDYFKVREFILAITQKVRQEERRNLLKELLPIIQEDIDFGAKNQQIVSTKAQARVLVLLSALSQEE